MRLNCSIGIIAIVVSSVAVDAADNVLVDAVRSGNTLTRLGCRPERHP